jgi:hypothetical protein
LALDHFRLEREGDVVEDLLGLCKHGRVLSAAIILVLSLPLQACSRGRGYLLVDKLGNKAIGIWRSLFVVDDWKGV